MKGIDSRRSAARAVVGTMALGGALACSLTLGIEDGHPCQSDADCAYSNGGQGTCVDNVCRGPEDEAGTTSDSPTSSGQPTASTMTNITDDPTLTTASDTEDES